MIGLFCKRALYLSAKEPYISLQKSPIHSSRLLKIIGLFCKRALYKRRYSAKKTSVYLQRIPTDMLGSFADMLGSFVDMLGSFADMLGSFADMLGSFADM